MAWMLRNFRRWVRGAPPLLDRFSQQHAEIDEILRNRSYDVGMIEHFWCAPYLAQLSKVCRRTVLDLHNVESALHASCARAGSWPLSSAHRRFENSYVREERSCLPGFSQLLVTSEDDAKNRAGKIVPRTMRTACANWHPPPR
jgi:hypothetical protein